MKPHDLARALKTVPERRLRLVELAHDCVDGQGKLRFDRCLLLAAEIQLASDEAREYARQTDKVRWALRNLLDR